MNFFGTQGQVTPNPFVQFNQISNSGVMLIMSCLSASFIKIRLKSDGMRHAKTCLRAYADSEVQIRFFFGVQVQVTLQLNAPN